MLDVLILAAGRGERLRPLTDHTPKPLVQIGEQTLIARHLNNLHAQGFSKVVINLAWLGDKIKNQLGYGAQFNLQIKYSYEEQGALGTGGGVANALDLLNTDPFIVINADVLTDYDFSQLQVGTDDDLHLVVVTNPHENPHGDFGLDGNRLVVKNNSAPSYTYAGIGCFRRRIFTKLKQNKYEMAPLIAKSVAAKRGSGELHSGRWFDIGSPARLNQARKLFVED